MRAPASRQPPAYRLDTAGDASAHSAPPRQRYDAIALGPPRQMANGMVVFSAIPALPGVYVYRRADGTSFTELIDADELSRADALATLAGATLTIEHPIEPVTPDNIEFVNWAGDVSDRIQTDAETGVPAIEIRVRPRRALDAMRTEGLKYLSCGYACDSTYAPGTHPEFGSYDYVQRNRVYNHVALTRHPRHGPAAHVRLDAAVREVPADWAAADPPPSREDAMNPLLIALAALCRLPSRDRYATDAALAAALEAHLAPLLTLDSDVRAAQPAPAEGEARTDGGSAVKLHKDMVGSFAKDKAAWEKEKADMGAAHSAALDAMKGECDALRAEKDNWFAEKLKEKAAKEEEEGKAAKAKKDAADAAELALLTADADALKVAKVDSAGQPKGLDALRTDCARAVVSESDWPAEPSPVYCGAALAAWRKARTDSGRDPRYDDFRVSGDPKAPLDSPPDNRQDQGDKPVSVWGQAAQRRAESAGSNA